MGRRYALWLVGLLWGPAVLAALSGADLARLAPQRNLLSNGSFEAVDGTLPRAWERPAHFEFVKAETGSALHGEYALAVDCPAAAAGAEVSSGQFLPANPRCTYQLTGWVNLVADRGATLGFRLLAQDRQRRVLAREEVWLQERVSGWQALSVQLTAPSQTSWLEVQAPVVRGGAKVLFDALSLNITAGPRGLPSGPSPAGLLARKVWPNAALLTWESLPGAFDLQYRALPSSPRRWETTPVLTEPHETLLELQADTDYAVRVRLALPTYYDEQGQVARSPLRPAESDVLTMHTPPLQPRRWNLLRLWPTAPLGTFRADQSYPCVEAYQSRLYVVECQDGGVHLSRVQPAGPRVEWTRQLLPRPENGQVLVGLVDTALLHDQLYVTYCLQPTNGGAGRFSQSRQMLAVYDLALDRLVGEPRALPALRPQAGTYSAGLAVFRDQVWAAWLEAWEEGTKRYTRLLLGPVSTAEPTPPQPWDAAPSNYLIGPGLGVFEGQLVVAFTDGAAADQRPGYEPLFAARYDGVVWRSPQKLADLGRNRYPRGVQWGDSYYLLHRTDAPYPSDNGLYQDLTLTVLGPRGLRLDTTPYVDDMTYNTCPDVAVLDNTLYIVYQKYDRAYGDPEHPARSLGTFLGKIETGAGG